MNNMPQSNFLICYQVKKNLFLLCLQDKAASNAEETIWAPAYFSTREEALDVFHFFKAGLVASTPDKPEFQALIKRLAEMNAVIVCFQDDAQQLEPFIEDRAPRIPVTPLIIQPHALLKMKEDFIQFKIADVLEELLHGTTTNPNGSNHIHFVLRE